jgi:hypothetical protein
MKTCRACNRELAEDVKIGRKDECPFCGADLRCCLNCVFYDRTVSKQCRETISELVKEKEKANFCEYFVFAKDRIAMGDVKSAQTHRALDDLFKK